MDRARQPVITASVFPETSCVMETTTAQTSQMSLTAVSKQIGFDVLNYIYFHFLCTVEPHYCTPRYYVDSDIRRSVVDPDFLPSRSRDDNK